GKGGYYSPEGKSMKSAFLKSPLRFTRISSRYSLSRRHPILGGLHPHLGIDYAAKTGTPVWSVADGVVQFVGWKGGYGRQVVIKHKGGYKTYYAHFSRFARGIRKGVRVKQKQIVGYVGATGLATGPHLDFRVSKNGTFMNPLSVKYPGGDPIPKKYEKDFEKEKTRLISLFEDTSFERMKIN
ncbi:MAG: M23 family metallopeptidase, partial [Thermodesulfobacteriota bacterium]|nr:M23 family metallopeptidase [Thermodesulfobacteriota bacterium]